MNDDAALEASLTDLADWSRDGDAISRTFRRRDWLDAIAFVNAVASEAERRNHHPDVSITGYRNVTFRLTSHDSGGVTQRDVNLARRIDELAAG
jgi:4a-hydroxytetrahydrobiopterin dehydratase